MCHISNNSYWVYTKIKKNNILIIDKILELLKLVKAQGGPSCLLQVVCIFVEFYLTDNFYRLTVLKLIVVKRVVCTVGYLIKMQTKIRLILLKKISLFFYQFQYFFLLH